MLLDWTALFPWLSNWNARDLHAPPPSAGPYRTPAPRPHCTRCAEVEADGLLAYLDATDAQRASATEILACDSCDRPCGVRIHASRPTSSATPVVASEHHVTSPPMTASIADL